MSRAAQNTCKHTIEYHVPALEKGLAILEYIATHGGKSLSQIQTELQISRTTAYSLLKNMEAIGYLKNDHGVFKPTLKLFSLGMQVQKQNYLGDGVLSELTALRDELKQTVHLCTFIGDSTVLLHKLDGLGAIQFRSYVGEIKKLHLSGGGKAIMAYLPESGFREYMSVFQRESSKQMLSAEEEPIIQSRRFTRRHGYALDDGEGEDGVFCIGVPVFATDGVIYGGLSITMLKGTVAMEKRDAYIKKVLLTGERLSRKIGYSGSYPPVCDDAQ